MPVDEVLRMLSLYETRYTGWTVKHFHERWQEEHGGRQSYSWMKKTLHGAGAVVRAPRRGAHRKKRPRKPVPGMMLHQDGSTHEWAPGCQWDLIVTLDHATSELYSACFVEEEGTMSSFWGLREVIETKGLFSSLYVDRGSSLLAHRRDQSPSRQDAAHARASSLATIGHHTDCRYSPEARGRFERVFRTLQDRLPKELALDRIADMAAANRFLRDRFLSAYNQRFASPAAEAAPPLFHGWAYPSPTFCVCTKIASWPTTILCSIKAGVCRSRQINTGSIT